MIGPVDVHQGADVLHRVKPGIEPVPIFGRRNFRPPGVNRRGAGQQVVELPVIGAGQIVRAKWIPEERILVGEIVEFSIVVDEFILLDDAVEDHLGWQAFASIVVLGTKRAAIGIAVAPEDRVVDPVSKPAAGIVVEASSEWPRAGVVRDG